MVTEINSVEDISSLLVAGFRNWNDYGCVTVKYEGNYALFNYRAEASFVNGWNNFEKMCRGLIINSVTGEIVARPFDKFFNWGEGGRKSESRIDIVTAKLDGSLGVLWRDGDTFRITTRGSFNSEQAQWATNFLNQHPHYRSLDTLFDEHNYLTLMFEIIYPSNRIVVDYGDKEDLVLIGARNRFTGEMLPYWRRAQLAGIYNFSLPEVYDFDVDVDTLISFANDLKGEEGFVVEFTDGSMYKIKASEYLRLHKLITNLSQAKALEMKRAGTSDEMLQSVPDEFLGEYRSWIAQIEAEFARIKSEVEEMYAQSPKDGERRDFAMWVKATCPHLMPHMFAMLDGKPIDDIIYKGMMK